MAVSELDAARTADYSKFAKCLISALEVRIKSNDKRINETIFQFAKSSEASRNANGDSPLNLAVNSGDLELVKHFADPTHPAQVSAALTDTNYEMENALLRAVQMCAKSGACFNPEVPERKETVLEYLLDQALKSTQKRKIFNQTTKRRQNLLHLAFAERCPKCDSFCTAGWLLKCLEVNKINVGVNLDDHKHFTPLFYLIRNTHKNRTGSEKSSVREADKELIMQRLQDLRAYCSELAIPFRSLLANSQGMDIAHVCAMSNCMDTLFEALAKAFSDSSQCLIELYCHRQSEFASQIVLGGPIDASQGPRSPRQRPFKYDMWTALHFACNWGRVDSIACLMGRGFSLQDCTRDGRACTDLACDKPDRKDAIRKAFEKVSADQSIPWVPDYARNVDSVRCALDSLEENCDNHEDSFAEMKADAELDRAWRLFQRTHTFKSAEESFQRKPLESLLYMCFENDSATQYRVLLHSSFWRRNCVDGRQKRNDTEGHVQESDGQESGNISLGEPLSDQSIIKFFLEFARPNGPEEEIEESHEVPIKERCHVSVDFISMTFERIRINRSQSSQTKKPLFSYRDNGKIFLRKLSKPNDYFELMSLVDLAIITGRPSMAKALLITRQFDLIPRAVAAIIRCNKLIRQEQLINYYPIRDINAELKGVKAFASTVTLNAIDALFHGCKDSEAGFIFEYLLGKMDTRDGTGTEGRLPHSKLKLQKIIWNNPCRPEVKTTDFSILELIRKSNKEDLYGAECIQQLVQKMWREPPEYSSTEFEDIRKTSPAIQDGTGEMNISDHLIRYVRCPRRTLMLYGISTLLYICLMIACLTYPSVSWNWVEVSLMCFLLSFIIQEAHECFIRMTTNGEGFLAYLCDIWNIYDLLNMFFLITAFAFKASVGANQWGDIDDLDATKLVGEAAVYNHFYYKALMSVSLLLASAKFLKTLRYSRPIGTNVVIMPYIFYRDLLPFVIILSLMIISFGVIFMSLLTVGRYSFDGATVKRRSDESMFDIYTRPLLSAFGEFQLDSLGACSPGTNDTVVNGCYFPYAAKIFVRFLLILFLLLVNLVMFNMLIAKFSNTVSRLEKRSQQIWLAMRHELLIEYCRLSCWPPPLNIFGTIWKMLAHWHRLCRRCSVRTQSSNDAKCQNSQQCLRCRLCLKMQESKKIGKSHENFLIRQAEQFRGKRFKIWAQAAETIEDDIEVELLGEKDLAPELAGIKFDASPSPSAGSVDKTQRQLSRLLRWVKRGRVAASRLNDVTRQSEPDIGEDET